MMVSNGQVRVWQQPGEAVRSGLSSGHVMVRQQSDEGRQWSCQGSASCQIKFGSGQLKIGSCQVKIGSGQVKVSSGHVRVRLQLCSGSPAVK